MNIQYPSLPETESWTKEQCLKHEKELLGFYLTDNPLSKYEDDIFELTFQKGKGDILYMSGIIADVKERFDKKGNKWGLVTIETLENSVQLYIFN